MARKTHAVVKEQAKYAKGFLAQLKTPADISAAAKQIAKERGIKYESARRNLERYTAGSRTLKSGKKSTAKQTRNLEKSHNLPPIIERVPEEKFEPGDIEIKGKIKYSEDVRTRTVAFALKAGEMKHFLLAQTKRDQADVVTSIKRFVNFEVLRVDAVSVIE